MCLVKVQPAEKDHNHAPVCTSLEFEQGSTHTRRSTLMKHLLPFYDWPVIDSSGCSTHEHPALATAVRRTMCGRVGACCASLHMKKRACQRTLVCTSPSDILHQVTTHLLRSRSSLHAPCRTPRLRAACRSHRGEEATEGGVGGRR